MTDHPIIRADFVKPQPVPSRKVLQLVFEVPEEQADHAMAVLGGYPQSGENRWCAIAQLAEGIPSETGVTAEQIGAEAIAQLKAGQPSEAAPESVKGMPTEADEDTDDTVAVPDEEACPDCAGKGRTILDLTADPPTVGVCDKCKGTGRAETKKIPASHRVKQPSEATTEPEQKPVRERRDWDDVPPREQACIRCNEPDFQTWLHQYLGGGQGEFPTDQAVRNYCGVKSRKEIIKGSEAHVWWAKLDEEYQDFIGKQRYQAQLESGPS